ncbi:hypothetical protein CBL_01035 [Carabus blaptoides fortunei]
MQKNNTVFLCDKELADVVVASDSRGNHNLMSSLKYNRLVNVQNASHLFNKNTVLVRDKRLTDTLIVSDCFGNNSIQTMSETSADGGERNVFMEVLHSVQRDQNQAAIDKYLEAKRQSLQDKLQTATQMYISGNYFKALEHYHHALTQIETDSYPDEFRLEKSDIFRLKYALILSNMGMNLYGPLKTACEMCSTLILTYGAEYPSLYLTLGRAKVLLNLYESARIFLETGLTVLDECVVLSHLTFPASDHIIPDTDPTTLLCNLEKTLENCRNVPKPDVKCCYRLCIADSKAIYFNGPSFIGYVNVSCSERCQFNYHRACWKVKLKTDRVKKPSAILNKQCRTDSCSGVISEIKILDQKLKVNAAIRAKATHEPSSSGDNYTYSRDSNIVESRVYETQFQLPTATFSNLKPNATEFTPGKHHTITLHLKNACKKGPRLFDDMDTTPEVVTDDLPVPRSSLKADVPEFQPAQVEQRAHKLTKWSTNAESTLPDHIYKAPILEVDLNGVIPSSTDGFIHVPHDLGELSEQPVPAGVEENGAEKLIPTEDKFVWTEPVASEYIPTQCQIDTSSPQTQTPTNVCDNKYPESTGTQTEHILDKRQKNCLKWIHSTCTPAVCHADVLHTSNQKLEAELKDLKKMSRMDKDCFAECKRNYHAEVDGLKSTVADLESQLTAVRSELQEYEENNKLVSVNKILLEQIQCNKNLYLPYLKTFEDKCKHMIWELEGLLVLTTVDGTPSTEEVEDSLYLWRNALADVDTRQRIVMQHYERLLCNITSHQYAAELQSPDYSLLVEPPNIMLRHFKPLLVINKRLDQDIANQMTNFYRIMSTRQSADTELQNNTEFAAQRVTDCSNPSPAAENGQGAVAKVKAQVAPVKPPPNSAPSAAQRATKMRQSRTTQELESAQCSPTGQQPKRPVLGVKGIDALIETFQNQFPLIDGPVITEALFSVRAQRGGLTGMSSTELYAEVKKYLRQKQPKKAPAVNPWNTINTPVQWHSDQQDNCCSICFERMTPQNSVTLRCQHLYHSILYFLPLELELFNLGWFFAVYQNLATIKQYLPDMSFVYDIGCRVSTT